MEFYHNLQLSYSRDIYLLKKVRTHRDKSMRVYTVILEARSDEQGFFAKYLHAFVSVFKINVISNVLTVCPY